MPRANRVRRARKAPPGPKDHKVPPVLRAYLGVFLANEIVEADATVPVFQSRFVRATCPEGKKAIGGGYLSTGMNPTDNRPQVGLGASRGQSWVVEAFNGTTATLTLNAYAICANVS